MKIIVADPAKNITVFVLDPVESPSERAALARILMAEKRLGAEQVGFVVPPGMAGSSGPAHWRTPWRLEMAGGEFCGNASRSFGLYVARTRGLKGKVKLAVSVSGANELVAVELDMEKGRASAEMPKPKAIETLEYEGRPLPLLVFEGITHVIAPDLQPDTKTFYAVMELAEKRFGAFPAFGLMFYDTCSVFMRPAVYVRGAGSLVFESSCGSGSAALGVWLSRELHSGAASYALIQPGGVIETEVTKKAGELVGIKIGGEVKLGDIEDFP